MNKENQRIEIAKYCGFSDIKPYHSANWALCGWVERFREHQHVPDYLNDFGAMHQAEEFITNHSDIEKYSDYLAQIVLGFDPDKKGILSINGWCAFRLARATTEQRAEAFLKTIDKWQYE